jgi:hypothetical protein
VAVGDEPFARCWSVACFLFTKAQIQPPIDTDPLPPNGRTPHPPPSPPLRWLGDGEPSPRCGHGHVQEGSDSCTRVRKDQMMQDVSANQAMMAHGNSVATGGLAA